MFYPIAKEDVFSYLTSEKSFNTSEQVFCHVKNEDKALISKEICSKIHIQLAVARIFYYKYFLNYDAALSFYVPSTFSDEDISLLQRSFETTCVYSNENTPIYVQVEGMPDITYQCFKRLLENNQLNFYLTHFIFHQGIVNHSNDNSPYRYYNDANIVDFDSFEQFKNDPFIKFIVGNNDYSLFSDIIEVNNFSKEELNSDIYIFYLSKLSKELLLLCTLNDKFCTQHLMINRLK